MENPDYVLDVLARRCGWLEESERNAVLRDACSIMHASRHQGDLALTKLALLRALDVAKRAGRGVAATGDATHVDEMALRKIIAGLSERRRVILKLRYFFDRTPAEIQSFLEIRERVYRCELGCALDQLAEGLKLGPHGTFCDNRRRSIAAYVAGVAGRRQAEQARRHLETCAPCASWAVELRDGARQAAAVILLSGGQVSVDRLTPRTRLADWLKQRLHNGAERSGARVLQ